MRYQQPIYIQNENSAVRNKDILNVNMSSDMCVFGSPLFVMSGASKIDCGVSTGTTYIITASTETIPLTFYFTGNTDSFTANSTTFRYEIYKYNSFVSGFTLPPVYQSEELEYSGFSGTSTVSENISVSGLSLDGEYLVKAYYKFDACTNFLYQLGKTVDTLAFRGGGQYGGLYDNNLDYYFIAFKTAEKPHFLSNGTYTSNANQLFQQTILPENDETVFVVSSNYAGYFVVTLNGLALSKDLDYSLSGNVITLVDKTVKGDVLTIIYTTVSGNAKLIGDTIYVNSPVVSGVTNGEGSNQAYFDTTTGKYEIYLTSEPASGGDVLVMINGATLANNIDYYKSTSNTRRIILEGDILVGDVITMVYFPSSSVINGITTNNPLIVWSVNNAPQLSNGIFTLEVSTGSTFSSLYYSNSQNYIPNINQYSASFSASGTVGTKLYYRVKNQKNFETLCGDIITNIAYSDIVPITIQSNAINSY
jgi:hypothetical protein